MPLDKLRKQILDDAQRQEREIEGGARKQAEEIIGQARARAKEAEDKAGAELAAEISRREEEQRANFELQERGMLLEARNKAVEGLMPKVKALALKNVTESGYSRFLARAIEKAGEIAAHEKLVLTVGKKDAKYIKNFDGKVKYGDVGRGVELGTDDGKVKLAATLEGLFEENRRAIETMLINEVFPKMQEEETKGKGGKQEAKPRKAKKAKKRK